MVSCAVYRDLMIVGIGAAHIEINSGFVVLDTQICYYSYWIRATLVRVNVRRKHYGFDFAYSKSQPATLSMRKGQSSIIFKLRIMNILDSNNYSSITDSRSSMLQLPIRTNFSPSAFPIYFIDDCCLDLDTETIKHR